MATLSDPGRYAVASLFALMMRDDFDREFREETMRHLLQHLNLAKSETTMLMLMDGLAGDHWTEPYVDMLFEEPDLCGDGTLVIYDALHWTLQKGVYDARIRFVFQKLAELFNLRREHLEMLEDAVVSRVTLADGPTTTKTKEEEELEMKRAKRKKYGKYAMIGAASVGGGVLLGVTGGLIAPLLGASIGALIGVSGVATVGTVSAVFGSLFGAAGAGVTGYKMSKRVGDIEEFTFVCLSPGQGSRLHVTIAVPGWLPPPPSPKEDDDDDQEDSHEKMQVRFMEPWKCLAHSREQYGLQYESKYMSELGQAMNVVYNMAISFAATEILKMTALHSVMAAVALPRTLLGLTAVIDNPWSLCSNRAVQVGESLAHELMDGNFIGRRPTTLIGFSLGARVIFYCLKELQRKGAAGIVLDAVLIGAPVDGSALEWRPFLEQGIVGGRLVNAYSQNDWLLKILYRTASASYVIAGLGAIDMSHSRLFNIDLSDMINGHGDYRNKAIDCMKKCRITIDEEAEIVDDQDDVVVVGRGNEDSGGSSSDHEGEEEEQSLLLMAA